MSTKLRAIIIVGGLALALGWAIYSSYLKYSLYLPDVGDKLPSFSLKGLDGEVLSLDELVKEREGIIINFMATWCPPCIEEMPALLKAGEIFEEKNISLVFIAGDSHPDDVKKVRENFKIKFPILLDETGKTGESYGITGYPETFIGNREKIIVKKYIGPQNWDSHEFIMTVLQALLGQKK